VLVAAGIASHSLTTTFNRPSGFPYWTGGFLLQGATEFSAGGKTAVSYAPSLQLIHPDTEYRLGFGGIGHKWLESWVVFSPRPHWQPWMELPKLLSGIHHLPIPATKEGRVILRCAIDTIRLGTETPEWRSEIVENAMEKVLILAHLASPELAFRGNSDDDRMRAVMAAVENDLATKWTVKRLADVAHLSPSRFAHLFSEEIGTAPMRYVEQLRVGRACDLLLSTNRAIGQVAAEVGYTNPLHFSTRFRNLKGRSPTAYRRYPTA